jgi:Zn-dependent protease
MEQFVAKISIMLVPALLAVTLHEVAHGYVADRFGDPTARLLGRLTLNPLKHLDPIGTLALIVFKFGWARPFRSIIGIYETRKEIWYGSPWPGLQPISAWRLFPHC